MYGRGDREFILDMLEACNRIISYTKGKDYNYFCHNALLQDAVVRNIEILGEAAKKISSQLKDRYPEVEWKQIARTRDKVIHFYFGIDVSIIWDIIQIDIPNLRYKLESIIEKEGWINA